MERAMTTGEVAREFGVTETYLQGLIRSGKINPRPVLRRNRRQWSKQNRENVRRVLA